MLTKRDNFALGCAGLAIAGTPALSAMKITNPLAYQIDGQTYYKAATDNIAAVILPSTAPVPTPLPVALTAIGASRQTVMWVYLNAAGTMYIEQAQIKAGGALLTPPSLTGAGYQAGLFEWPGDRPGYALIGAIKVSTNASGAFTPASTSLATGNMTVTYFNVGPDLALGIPY